MTNLDLPPNERLVGTKELRTLVPYSPSQIRRLENKGAFPSRIRIGECKVAWSYRAVMEWIENKKSSSIADAEH